MSGATTTHVILVGPAAPTRGGIAAVVDALHGSSLRTQFDLALLNTAKTTPENRPWYVAVWSQVRLFGRFAAMLLRRHVDLVHIHTCSGVVFWRDSVLLLIARLFRRRAILHIHGGGFEEFISRMRGIRRLMLSFVFLMSDAAIVLSESWQARLGRHLNVRRWAVVANGVALSCRRSTVANTGSVLFVGTLDSKKGADDLVAATAIAIRSGFKGRVSVAGKETVSGQRERLQRLIEREGLVDRIRLLGEVSGQAKVKAFEDACFFVLPSYVEGLPIAMLEAMSYGLPVIITDVGAVSEVVTDGTEGFVIRPGDVTALADRMTRLWTDALLRDKMGAAGRRRVANSFTVDAMAARVADVYRDVMRR